MSISFLRDHVLGRGRKAGTAKSILVNCPVSVGEGPPLALGLIGPLHKEIVNWLAHAIQLSASLPGALGLPDILYQTI